MSDFTKPLPEWNEPGIEPPKSKKDEGWRAGDKPPAAWHNWWMYTSYQALKEMRDYLDNFEAVSSWEDIKNKPETFPPSSHNHAISDVTNLSTELNQKAEKVEGKGLSTNDYTDQDKNKLAGIDENANNYKHPETHQASMIVESPERRFVTDDDKETWNNKQDALPVEQKRNIYISETAPESPSENDIWIEIEPEEGEGDG